MGRGMNELLLVLCLIGLAGMLRSVTQRRRM
jgi:hypothetical protein